MRSSRNSKTERLTVPFQSVYPVRQIRAIEQAALNAGQPLMARAGLAAATLARRLLNEMPRSPGRGVLLVAGPGNNGGDALECALHLKQWYYRVSMVLAGDEAKLPPDARNALAKWRQAGGTLEADIPAGGHWDLVVDGLFGIGLARPISAGHAELVARINALQTPVLALDIPSGLNADTGAVLGVAVRATDTLSFIGLKPGLLTLDGPDHCGRLHCAPLEVETSQTMPEGQLLDEGVRDALPRRPANFHKGSAGDVGVIGGAEGMVGAALLAGRAALRMGTGRVFVACLAAHAPAVDMHYPELMMRAPESVLAQCPVLLLGPGMGTEVRASDLLRRALEGRQTLVLDADALNLLAGNASLAALLNGRTGAALMTPHPGEAARLLGMSTPQVQQDRIASALALARRYHCPALLKGNGSVLAEPSGRWWINPTGNPGMASAGMGDTLAGMLASLLAQGMRPDQALCLAVWMHGAAADELVAAGRGPRGITASDVMAQAHLILNRPR